MMRGTRSRYWASIRFSHRSGGSLAWLSVETMKYFFGSPTRAVRTQPEWPGVSRRQRLGALIGTSFIAVLPRCYSRVGVWHIRAKRPEPRMHAPANVLSAARRQGLFRPAHDPDHAGAAAAAEEQSV